MLMALGGVVGLTLLAGAIVAVLLAFRAAADRMDDSAPVSRPSEFVAPVSSGGYAFRAVDESPAEFQERVSRV